MTLKTDSIEELAEEIERETGVEFSGPNHNMLNKTQLRDLRNWIKARSGDVDETEVRVVAEHLERVVEDLDNPRIKLITDWLPGQLKEEAQRLRGAITQTNEQ